ncbi:MAG: hypothetical protein F6K17_26850 [Okeania sp. SIO3C4]|nr:hypothetical protein [Okeania sp. SIO3B3]NER05947.1 hypothetical protein [Okeania sp. SIO3C4]
MAAQNDEEASNNINFTNQDNSINYGNQYGIGIQNNVILNLNFYLEKGDVNCPYKESSFLPQDAEYFFGRDDF